MKTIYDKNQSKIVEFIGNDDSSMKDLKDLILRNAVFTLANLEGWFLDNCYCEGAGFEQADLYWAHLGYCNFSRCNIILKIMVQRISRQIVSRTQNTLIGGNL